MVVPYAIGTTKDQSGIAVCIDAMNVLGPSTFTLACFDHDLGCASHIFRRQIRAALVDQLLKDLSPFPTHVVLATLLWAQLEQHSFDFPCPIVFRHPTRRNLHPHANRFTTDRARAYKTHHEANSQTYIPFSVCRKERCGDN